MTYAPRRHAAVPNAIENVMTKKELRDQGGRDLVPSSGGRVVSDVVPRGSGASPRLDSGMREALRPPPPPRISPKAESSPPPPPAPATTDLFDEEEDLTESTLVETVSAHLVSASRPDAPLEADRDDDDDPPTRETPIDLEAMLRVVSAEGLSSPTGDDARAPTADLPPSPASTPRMREVTVAPIHTPPSGVPSSQPPPYPLMRRQLHTIPSPPVDFAPQGLISPPSSSPPPSAQHYSAQPHAAPHYTPPPYLPPPSSSSMRSGDFTGAPSSARMRAATGTFTLPPASVRRAFLANLAPEPPPSRFWRNVGLVAIALSIAAGMLAIAHVVTGGAIWHP